MGDQELYQAVGRIEGKLDALVDVVSSHIKTYEERHQTVWKAVDCIKKDINQAKGAKGILVVLSGTVAALVATVGHFADKLMK